MIYNFVNLSVCSCATFGDCLKVSRFLELKSMFMFYYCLWFSLRPSAMDVLDPASMKTAANCINQYDSQTSKNHQVVERKWRLSSSWDKACSVQCLKG
jgi:hypothetical protein